MSISKKGPCALTIAGSDSGGGAGIQADLKTFAAHGVHGVSAITCTTAQNPSTVIGVQPCSPKLLAQQLEAVHAFKPAAMKTGMLYSKTLIDRVIEFVEANPKIKLVVDPVMIATSGSELLKPSGVASLKRLLPHAALITPNIPEAIALRGAPIIDTENQRTAARELHELFGCTTLVKGGHMGKSGDVADILFDGDDEYLLTAPRVKSAASHGTGCTLSAAITANLALGNSLLQSVSAAKEFITGAIANGRRVGDYRVLNPFWRYHEHKSPDALA